MDRKHVLDGAEDLVRGAELFSRWRRSRAIGARIPLELWQVALELGRRHGVSRTAGALKVDYYCHNKRIAKAEDSESAGNCAGNGTDPTGLVASKARFVELPFPSPPSSSGECAIEWEKPSGSRLRVSFQGRELPDLAVLGRDFWEVG
jgi:hypothetical protein